MELIRGLHNIQPHHRGCVLTIGNFDGVHLGHQAVLAKVVAIARQMQLPSCVMLFEPQPLEVFAGDAAPARLTRFREKYEALARLGVDRLLCVHFTPAFAAQAPEQFIQQLLLKQLGVEQLIVGDDFRFGKNRSGSFDLLALAAEQHQFGLYSTSSLLLGQQRISSTLIRQALADDPYLREGLNVHKGQVTYQAVAEALGYAIQQGRRGGAHLRPELRGQLCFVGIYGPMWGGTSADGSPTSPRASTTSACTTSMCSKATTFSSAACCIPRARRLPAHACAR